MDIFISLIVVNILLTYVVVAQSSSHVRLFATLWRLQHARPPCPSQSPRVSPCSCPLSQWCHPTISFSVSLFSFCPQSFPAPGSFPMSQLFTLGGQSIYFIYIYIYMSKHQVVHLKYIQFFNCQLYLNKLGKKFFPKNNFSKSYLKPRLILGKCQCLVIPQSLILDPR